jgi:hypothetical protein
VAQEVRSSEFRLVISTQWLRPTPRIALLKFESDLVCAPCQHGKMIAVSHSPVNTMMTECPG